ncbi:MAG: outer membrane lipoprotein carrier protein LolA [Lysobacteraceae bacterium]
MNVPGRGVLIGLLWILCGTVQAQERADFDAVAARVEQAEVLRGDFSQEKHVEGFRNPLRSSGRFLLANGRGVLWETLAPFPGEMVITRERIASRQPDGSQRIEVDASRQPGLAAVNSTLFALMSGDVAALSARFEGEAQLLPEGRWRLELVPRPGPLAQAFSTLSIEGGRFVEQVELLDTQGDRTRIVFSALATGPALEAGEAARLD